MKSDLAPVKMRRRKRITRKFRNPNSDIGDMDIVCLKPSHINFSIGSDNLSKKKSPLFTCFKKNRAMYTCEDLHDNVLRLHKYCLTHLLDTYRVHLNRLKGINVLNEIIHKVYFDDLKISQVVRIIWCSISIVHHFHIRLKIGSGFNAWKRRHQANLANVSFDRLMQLLLPDLFSTVIHSIITFFEEARLWNTELLCSDLLKRVLIICSEYEKCLNVLLDLVEQSHPAVARKVLRVIYDILDTHVWQSIDDDLTYRFLCLYRDSLSPSETQDFTYANKGFEICLRRLFKNIKNEDLLSVLDAMLDWALSEEIRDEALLDFGNVVEYASMLRTTNFYKDTLTDNIVTNLLNLIASDNVLKSLLGHRILQHLIDRQDNKEAFDVPRIFFQNTNFSIHVSKYNPEDKALLKKYRDVMHDAILISVKKHGMHRINLESAYCTIAILVVEVPCGYTAAAMACLVMAIQEVTTACNYIELESSNRIHGTVISIMSLICWVHSAEIFYEYLNTVLQRRAQYAPHLNPPLLITYQYARHHILWNKPELFFEDWEVRYGLWKCFRSAKHADNEDVPSSPQRVTIQPLKETQRSKEDSQEGNSNFFVRESTHPISEDPII